jgi:transketolase
MGELFGEAVSGELFHVPRVEFERILAWRGDRFRRAALFADMCRVNALYMIARAGSGHIGSSFSAMDIVSWLHLEEMRPRPGATRDGIADRYFSSKGHDAPGLYAVLAALGRLDFDLLHRLRRRGGLPGHPDIATPGMITNTGSLGMGVSKAKGMIRGNRLRGRDERIFVMTGDGELQEGQFWESLLSAANDRLHELTIIVDHNKLQSDTFVACVSDLGDLPGKLASFGWHVQRCSGHDFSALAAALQQHDAERRPRAIVADTVKGCGVSIMEHTAMQLDQAYYKFHSGAPAYEAYLGGVRELVARVDDRLAAGGLEALRLVSSEIEKRPQQTANVQRMVGAYSSALVEHAARNRDVVVLDADLVLDTGLIPFKERFPERFIECGIAEQDMVSQAGGLALKGLVPVVHSFACFLSARPNEQIYNNATERTRIVYAASLAGLVPGGPGHSHQAVRDISALAATPGLVMVEGADEVETRQLVDWGLEQNEGSTYIRLVSIPCVVPYETRAKRPQVGVGERLLDGGDVVVIGYGPVVLPQAWWAAEMLGRNGVTVRLLNLPWLNRVDEAWLRREVDGFRALLTVDNHYVAGGQGEMICAALARINLASLRSVRSLGVVDVPVCGTNDEVLTAHGLDARSIVSAVESMLAEPA